MVVGALFLAKGVSGVGAMMQAVTLGTTWSHGGYYSIRHGIFRDSTAAWRMTRINSAKALGRGGQCCATRWFQDPQIRRLPEYPCLRSIHRCP